MNSLAELLLQVRLPGVKRRVVAKQARVLMSNNLAESLLLVPLLVKRVVSGKEGRVFMANLAAVKAAGPRLVPSVGRGNQKAERKKVRSPLRLPALDNKKLKIDAPSWNDPDRATYNAGLCRGRGMVLEFYSDCRLRACPLQQLSNLHRVQRRALE